MKPLRVAGLKSSSATLLALALLALSMAVLPAFFAASAASEPIAQRIARFNQLLLREPWRQEPVLIALLWSGKPKGSERTIIYRADGENPQKATVTLTEEGLPDDALGGSRTIFSFNKVKGQWTLIGVNEAWRCRRGPNSRAFATAMCP